MNTDKPAPDREDLFERLQRDLVDSYSEIEYPRIDFPEGERHED